MPRRKKLPAVPNYEGVARNADNMLVQKSTPLQTLAQTNLNLTELKILDAYLSRIDSHKPNERYVRFEKGELERLLGVTRILKDDLSKRMDNLFQVVTIEDPNKPKGFTKIGLFEKAEAFQDDDGLWKIDLACSEAAMEYMFNIENLRYLKYRLKNVIELTSRYSYVLYLYLEKNRMRGSWEVTIEELKQVLRCTSDSYAAYKEFNDKILKKCHKEINAKTTLTFAYQPIRKGTKVYKVKFIMEAEQEDKTENTTNSVPSKSTEEKPKIESKDAAASYTEDGVKSQETYVQAAGEDGADEYKTNENAASNSAANAHYYYGNSFDETTTDNNEMFAAQNDLTKEIKLLAAACDNEFSPKQMQMIAGYIGFFIKDELIKYSYLRQMYERLNAEAKPDADRFSVFRKMIEADPELRLHND